MSKRIGVVSERVADGAILAHAFVPGAPKTKGSLKMIPGRKCRCCVKCRGYLDKGHAEESVIGSKHWRSMMAEGLTAEMIRMGSQVAHSGLVTVQAAFYLPCPLVIGGGSGDVDKLLRNLLDAATDSKVYGDDVQVARVVVDKFALDEEWPQGVFQGAAIVVFAGRV